jgi:hypothetical protein
MRAPFNEGPEIVTQLMVPGGILSQFNNGGLTLRDEAQFNLGQL